jgi:hypothetical protein
MKLHDHELAIGFAISALAGTLLGVALGNTTPPAVALPAPKVVVVTRVLGVKDFARSLLTARQFKCLDFVVTHESHWNPSAVNPDSGASGLGQLMPSTWRNLGYTPTKVADAQLLATLVYIARHYGSGGPCAAKKYWLKNYSY